MAGDIPITYVPARNALFLCHALAWAEVLGARDLFAGMNALDYCGYPDCRPEFLAAFETMARLGTKAGAEGGEWRVRAPLIAMTKAEIIRAGVALGVDYAITHSCYDPMACRRRAGVRPLRLVPVAQEGLRRRRRRRSDALRAAIAPRRQRTRARAATIGSCATASAASCAQRLLVDSTQRARAVVASDDVTRR